MRSTSVRISVTASAALLTLIILGSNVLAQSVSVSPETANGQNTTQTSFLLPLGQSLDFTCIAVSDAPTPPYTCTITSGPVWSATT